MHPGLVSVHNTEKKTDAMMYGNELPDPHTGQMRAWWGGEERRGELGRGLLRRWRIRMKDVRWILSHGNILELLLECLDQILGKADALLAITEELADGKDRVRVAGDRAVYACRVISLAFGFGLCGFHRLWLHLVAEETEEGLGSIWELGGNGKTRHARYAEDKALEARI